VSRPRVPRRGLVPRPPRVPRWGLVSAAAAPVLLVGGWTLAAARQRAGFDPVSGTISALAARDADDRWVMTAALAGTGLCHLVTAAALRPAPRAARVGLAAGGVGTLLVAAFPLPTGGGTSVPHTAAAALAFGALSLWPAAAGDRWATTALLALLAAFTTELVTDGPAVGTTERLAATAQSLYPLLAALRLRRPM
jgi:hypothetical membrane protein